MNVRFRTLRGIVVLQRIADSQQYPTASGGHGSPSGIG
jgi:hypothetical protein